MEVSFSLKIYLISPNQTFFEGCHIIYHCYDAIMYPVVGASIKIDSEVSD